MIVIGVLALAGPARADPLTFANVQAAWTGPDGHFFVVDLFTNPGAILPGQVIEVAPGVRRAVVTFFIPVFGSLPPGETDTLRETYHLPSIGGPPFSHPIQDVSIPVFGSIFPPFTDVGGLDFPVLYRPHPMSLTVDLLRSAPDFVIPSGPRVGEAVDSWTYTFSVVQPAPEPTSILLLGGGLSVMLGGLRLHERPPE